MLGRVAVYSARRRVNKSLYAGVLRGNQHVHESVDIDRIRSQRIVHRPRNRTKRRVMEDELGACTGRAACPEVANISFDHVKASCALEWPSENVVEICPIAGREIIDADHCLAKRQQLLKQVGADEASNAGNDPGFRRGTKLFAKNAV